MKKALAIGAIAATALLLAGCQQPKPAAVETPVTPTPAVTEPTTSPTTRLDVKGTATISEATEGKETIKVTGVAEVGGEAGAKTELVISPKAVIEEGATDTLKVSGSADIAPVVTP